MYDDCVICIIIALFCMCFVPKRAAEEMEREKRVRLQKLLLKQRDIMIALTGRLNERDETIIQLQEELDAYDRINRETELFIDQAER